MTTRFIEVSSSSNIRTVASIAREVWNEHYCTILSKGQIDYMLQKFQSEEAIEKQITAEGYKYYLIANTLSYSYLTDQINQSAGDLQEAVGYIGIKVMDGRLFLSKLYILKQFRGKGYASAAFDFMGQYAQKNSLSAIWLTVNKENGHSISVYMKRGFEIVRDQISDIGNGYVMDDHIMQKTIQPLL